MTGCVSSSASAEEKPVIDGTATLLLMQIPELPAAPSFPSGLNWGYDTEHNLYTLDDAGVDALLDFRDDRYGSADTRGFLYDLETWRLQYEAVVERITALGL